MDEKVRNISTARRQDRSRSEAWIGKTLESAPFGVLATADETQPYIHPTTFVYDESARALYFHTYREGRTRTNVERNRLVSFGTAEMGRLLPADTAKGMSVEYASVIVFGSCRIVTDENEALCALQMLVDKYFPHLRAGEDYRPTTAAELALVTVFRLDISEWSGKEKRVGPDSPGAFHYGHQPGKV
jgi:nitroimidazol reductase NimA-like FMN-containing flavoprotein (pyridoxamine 5'-phosphate oxidase superfamily)